jgi:hypothetical protein
VKYNKERNECKQSKKAIEDAKQEGMYNEIKDRKKYMEREIMKRGNEKKIKAGKTIKIILAAV